MNERTLAGAQGLGPLPAPPGPPGNPSPATPSGTGGKGSRQVDLVAAERVTEQVERLLEVAPSRRGTAATRRWLQAVDEVLSFAGEHDRARLLQARASVRGRVESTIGLAGQAQQDSAAAAELYERLGESLAAANNYAAAATAAVRSGHIGPALDTAVRALVAFEAAPGDEQDGHDPAGEASLAVTLGALCQHFLDYPRALHCYETALAGSTGPDDAARWSHTMHSIAEVLLAQVRESGPDDPARASRLDRVEELARQLITNGSPDPVRTIDGPRLLAEVLCEQGRPQPAWRLLRQARRQVPADSPDPGSRAGALHLTAGHCLHLLGRPDEAVTELDAALASLATEADLAAQILALRLRSRARQQAGDLPGALDDARRLADLVCSRHRRQVGGFMDQLWSRAEVEGERRDLEARTRDLLRSAEQDPLTGLANRRALERFCSQLPGRAEVCLVLVDVDDFKGVNDRYGHAVGDSVLRAMAALLTRSVRGVDVVARWGGEEFLIALPSGAGRLGTDAAARVCRRVREHPWHRLAPGLRVTVSAGVADGPVIELDDVLRRADEAMYRAKKSGRDRVVAG